MSSKVCVIGAGAAGLTAVKALLAEGVPFDCFERASDLGGLWRHGTDGGHTAAYRGLHINTSKKMMEFSDHPMPAELPEYPSHRQVFRYFSGYAERFGLRDAISFRHEVDHVEPVDGGAGGFDVTVTDLDAAGGDGESGAATRTERYRAVVVCNGHHWSPKRPDFPGSFDGEELHSFEYDQPEPFRGKRVVVVGIGNSGVDVATEVSLVTDQTFLSTRRSAWILPRFILGRPADHWDTPSGANLPLWLKRAVYSGLLKLSVGDQEAYGVRKPEHKLLGEHPTMSSALLERAAHGEVVVKPNVAELKGDRVRFEDGTEEAADAIIYATGYDIQFPFFDPGFLSADGNQITMYRRVAVPDVPNLYFVGLFQVVGAMMPIAELQSTWVAGLLTGRLQLPDRAAMDRVIEEDQAAMRARFTRSERHTVQVDYWPYIFTLREALTNRLDKPAPPGLSLGKVAAVAGAALAGGVAALAARRGKKRGGGAVSARRPVHSP